jgi:ParB-like chromosome segregation protein Spo0J
MALEFHQLDRRYQDLRLRRPERERRLLASLAEHAQQEPIVVVKAEDSYVVIDGFKRLRWLELLVLRVGHCPEGRRVS